MSQVRRLSLRQLNLFGKKWEEVGRLDVLIKQCRYDESAGSYRGWEYRDVCENLGCAYQGHVFDAAGIPACVSR